MAGMKQILKLETALMCGLPKVSSSSPSSSSLPSPSRALLPSSSILICLQVTLTGTIEDWKSVQSRARRFSEFDDPTLAEWAQVLDTVLEYFVAAFASMTYHLHPSSSLSPPSSFSYYILLGPDDVDKDFWDRIAHYTGGGSGPRYLEGWVLAFVAFDEQGKYFLNPLKKIKSSHKFGRMV